MLLDWTRTLVGVVVTACFAVPVYTAVSDRQLHEVPMAVLAGNLSVSGLLIGAVLLASGVYNLAQLQSRNACVIMQSTLLGSGVTFKFAHLCLAIDQFVAVVFPLRHHRRMARDVFWLLLATGIIWICIVSILLSTAWLDLETVGEKAYSSVNGTDEYAGCIWSDVLTNVGLHVLEGMLLTSSLITLILLIATGVIGSRAKAQLQRMLPQQPPDESTDHGRQRFLAVFSKFKITCAVLSLTYVFDLFVALLIRFNEPMKPANFIDQLRSIGFFIEGLAYGLLNTQMRAAYMKMSGVNMLLVMWSSQNAVQHQDRDVAAQHQGGNTAAACPHQNEPVRRPDLEMTARAPDLGMSAQDPDQDESAPDPSQDMSARHPSQDVADENPEQDGGDQDPSQEMTGQDPESDEADLSLERNMVDQLVGQDDPR